MLVIDRLPDKGTTGLHSGIRSTICVDQNSLYALSSKNCCFPVNGSHKTLLVFLHISVLSRSSVRPEILYEASKLLYFVRSQLHWFPTNSGEDTIAVCLVPFVASLASIAIVALGCTVVSCTVPSTSRRPRHHPRLAVKIGHFTAFRCAYERTKNMVGRVSRAAPEVGAERLVQFPAYSTLPSVQTDTPSRIDFCLSHPARQE